MERVVIADSWKQVLAENGLKTFKDFYYQDNKISINRNNRRKVSIIRLEGADGKKFFLKQFRHSHFKDIIFAFMNTGKFLSQAAYEWNNLEILAKNGIGAPTPVAYGEQFRLGLERKSFIITEELSGQCLSDFVTENWDKLPIFEKEKIITSLAREIKKIHNTEISLPDLYVWHIFISEENINGERTYKFAFIDLNRMKRNMWNKNEKVENLGRLHHSMLEKYFDKSLRRLLIETYAEGMNTEGIEKLIRNVKKFSKKYSARRTVKQY